MTSGNESTNVDAELVAARAIGNYGKGYEGWKDYTEGRPKYPEVVFAELFEYHDRLRPSERSLAVDHGTGNGTIVQRLLDEGFAQVEATDIGELQIEAAKQTFADEPRAHFAVYDATEKHDWIADGSASLVTCFESVHWLRDHFEDWFREVARVLKPGGTLAFCFYPAEINIISNDEANKVSKNYIRRTCFVDLETDPFFRYATGVRANLLWSVPVIESTKMHHVIPPASAFKDIKRIAWDKFETLTKKHVAQDCLDEAGPGWDEWRRGYELLDHRPCQMIRRMNMSGLMTYADTIHGAGIKMRKDPAWIEASQQIIELTGDDFMCGWPLMLCLATRK